MTRKKPHRAKLIDVIKKQDQKHKDFKIEIIKKYFDKPKKISGFYVCSSMQDQDIKAMLASGFEALRLAHIIARGISTGVSKGRI